MDPGFRFVGGGGEEGFPKAVGGWRGDRDHGPRGRFEAGADSSRDRGHEPREQFAGSRDRGHEPREQFAEAGADGNRDFFKPVVFHRGGKNG